MLGAIALGWPAGAEAQTLVGHYELNEGANPSIGLPATDATGIQDGQYLAAVPPGPVVGVPSGFPALGTAAEFITANNEEVNLGNPVQRDFATSFTLAAWIRPDNLGGTHRIIARHNRFAFATFGSRLRITTFGVVDINEPAGTPNLQLGAWHHAAVTMTPTETEFFLNGQSRGLAQGSTAGANGTGDWFIGGRGSGTEFFQGAIDDVRIYDGVLSAAAINQLYIDVAPPQVLRLQRLDENPVTSDTVRYEIEFSEPVTLTAANILVGTTLPGGVNPTAISGGPTVWTVALTPTNPADVGELDLTILANLQDLGGQVLQGNVGPSLPYRFNSGPDYLFSYDYDSANVSGQTISDISPAGNDAIASPTAVFVANTLPGGSSDQVLDTTNGQAVTAAQDLFGIADLADWGGITFETWAKRTSAGAGPLQAMISAEGVYNFQARTNAGVIELWISGSQAAQGPLSPVGEWYHIAGVYDTQGNTMAGGGIAGGVSRLYINGEQASLDIPAGTSGLTDSLHRRIGLGRHPQGNDNLFAGHLARTRVSKGPRGPQYILAAADLTPPSVDGITLTDVNPTASDSVNFSVEFSEPVTLTSPSIQVDVTGITSGIATVDVTGGPVIWDVAVTPVSPDDDGTIAITILAGVLDRLGKPLAANYGPSAAYTINNVIPGMLITARDPGPTAASSIVFDLEFTEPMDGVSTAVLNGGFTLAFTGTAAGSLTGVSGADGDTTYALTVTGVSGIGSIQLNLTNSSAITDSGTNANSPVPIDGPTVTIVGSTATDLVVHYKLDELDSPSSGSTAYDSSINGVHGTYLGSGSAGGPLLGVAAAAPSLETAALLDGTTDTVNLGNPAVLRDLTAGFTVAAWVRPAAAIAGTRSRIIACGTGGGWGFGINDIGLIFTTFTVQDYTQIANVNIGIWTHVAVVFDSNYDATFYTNGQVVNTVNGNRAANPGTGEWRLGNLERNGGMEFFNGGLDDVRVYNRELSAAEILDMAFGEPPTTRVKANWNLY